MNRFPDTPPTLAPLLSCLAVAGCLSPTVHQPGAARRARSEPVSATQQRDEPSTARQGHVVTSPRTGYPTLPKPPRPYSDWEAPWGWTYTPSLQSHWDGERALEHVEGKLEELQHSKPSTDDAASRERR